MKLTYRPLDAWPWPITDERGANPFGRADWTSTLDLLEREIDALDGGNVVIQADWSEKDLRLNGEIKSAASPASPRVVVAFDSMYGPIKMKCDRFDHWRVNVRAVAKGLQDLRRLERYGIASRGEQYTGWTALPSAATALGPAQMTRREAAEILVRTAGPAWYATEDPDVVDALYDAVQMLLEHPGENLDRCYKFAARNAHPDHGGNHAAMAECVAARDLLATSARA